MENNDEKNHLEDQKQEIITNNYLEHLYLVFFSKLTHVQIHI